jgi:predicted RNase H-like HicB family nuclease
MDWDTSTIDRAGFWGYDRTELLSPQRTWACSHADTDFSVFKKRENTMIQSHKVLIERDIQGGYVATFPGLRGYQAQARSLKMLMAEIQEAMALSPEVATPVPVPREMRSVSPDGGVG